MDLFEDGDLIEVNLEMDLEVDPEVDPEVEHQLSLEYDFRENQ